MIDKAARLFAQVNMDEALRELEAARKEEAVVQRTLKTLLNLETSGDISPSSPLFINDTLPPKMEFMQVVGISNYLLNQLSLQEHMAKQQVRIDQSGYLPNIALFGKQTLYSHGIQSNLLPRTMIGVGFTWNLFDGLEREKRIRQSRLTQQTLALGQEKARDDLSVGVDKLYTGLQKAFAEGMATSTEVVDAETLLSKTKVARLAAYYEYDVTLMNLLALCGIPEQFGSMKDVTSLPITENRRNEIEIE